VKSSTAFRINDSVDNILLLADQTVQRSLTQTCIRAAELDLECADSEGTGALSLTDGALLFTRSDGPIGQMVRLDT
jgi:hypothetical protein